MRISDWSSDLCSSDLLKNFGKFLVTVDRLRPDQGLCRGADHRYRHQRLYRRHRHAHVRRPLAARDASDGTSYLRERNDASAEPRPRRHEHRSEEHTSELQSLMRISYAVFCLNKKQRVTTNSSVK